MSARPDGTVVRRRPSIEAIVFDVVLIAFAGVIVFTALGISARAGLVPLVVGIPTLAGLVVLLVRDLVAPATPAAPETTAATAAPVDAQTAGVGDLLAAAHEEETADEQLPSTPEARRAQVLLAVWAIAYVALAMVVGFLVATPVALVVILLATTRRLVPTIAITVVACALLYLIFDIFLNVAF